MERRNFLKIAPLIVPALKGIALADRISFEDAKLDISLRQAYVDRMIYWYLNDSRFETEDECR
jgi:hypothetical protein